MRGMSESKTHQEDDEEMIKMNIKQFIEAARQYLFELAPTPAALATIAIRQDR